MKAIAKKATVMFMLACLLGGVGLIASSQQAHALETAKCTARPNGDDGKSTVLGNKETRITWEGQFGSDESVSSISFTLPEGTEFSTEDLKVTALGGDDHMDRITVDFTAVADGNNLIVSFTDPLAAGSYLRFEIYHVYFSKAGGDMQLTGAYTLTDGTSIEIADIPAITVTSVSLAQSWSNSLSEKTWVQKWNSNKFLRLFFNPPIIIQSFPIVFQGFLMAIGIVAVAFPIAIPIGFLLSLMRMSKRRVLRGIATTYVNVVRGTPLFLQIYIAFFGLPLAGINVANYPLGVIVLSLNSSAYLCEIFRAGIQSIPKGQFEASRSLGMNGAQTMLFVIIPQTVRRVLPTMTSEFILLYKDTSLLAAVGCMEIVMYAKTIVATTGSITPYIVAAVFYLVITLPMAKIVGKFENKLSDHQVVKGKKSRNRFGKKNDDAVVSEPASDVVEAEILSPENFSSM